MIKKTYRVTLTLSQDYKVEVPETSDPEHSDVYFEDELTKIMSDIEDDTHAFMTDAEYYELKAEEVK